MKKQEEKVNGQMKLERTDEQRLQFNSNRGEELEKLQHPITLLHVHMQN